MTSAQERPPVVVVATADEAFAPGLAALGSSVIRHRPPGRPLDLYMVDAGLLPATRDRLTASWHGDGVRVHWRRLEDATFVSAGMAVPTSARGRWLTLVLDRILPAGITRVLLLDADTLVLADLTPLWDVDLAGRALAAVRDTMIPHIQSDSYVSDDIDQSHPLPYFNAGVLLIDLERWTSEGLFQKARELRARHGSHLWGIDQQVLNWTLVGNWTPLPLAWNRMTHVLDIPSWRCTRVTEAEFTDAVACPRIAHFAGSAKPWRGGCRDDQAAAFREEMQRTAWAPWRPSPLGFVDMLANVLWREPHRRYQFIRRGLRLAEKEGLAKAPWYRAAAGLALSRPWSGVTFALTRLVRRATTGRARPRPFPD